MHSHTSKHSKCAKINPVDLIIFDLDGTLVDSKKDIVNAVNYTLRELNLKEKGFSEITSFIGSGVEDLLKKSLDNNQNLLNRALSIFKDYYRAHSTDQSALYPHVKDILEYFREKRKVIVTNRKKEFAQITLKILGIYDCFEDIIGGDDVGCLKPSACPLEKIIFKFKTDKKRTIIVGDMSIDVLAGKEAGIITCGVTYGIGDKDDIIKAKPDFVLDDILKLKEIIS